jgi:hypothetical protein
MRKSEYVCICMYVYIQDEIQIFVYSVQISTDA